jgi:hypothetical protein
MNLPSSTLTRRGDTNRVKSVEEPNQKKGSLQSLPLRLFFASLPVVGVLLLGWEGKETVTYFWASSPAALITLPVLVWQHAQRTGEKFIKEPANTPEEQAQLYIGICILFTVPSVFLMTLCYVLLDFSLMSRELIPLAIAVQTVRSYVLYSRFKTNISSRISSQISSQIFTPIFLLFIVLMVTGLMAGLMPEEVGERSVVAVAMLCAVSVAAELGETRFRRMRTR